MEVSFVKISPTQNMTILVTTPIPRNDQAKVAEALMDYGSVYAEQVGFLEPPGDGVANIHLQMMGGEFCGNATMSCAAYLAYMDHLPVNSEATYMIEVSGADSIVECHIVRKSDGYTGTVAMPVPTGIEYIDIDGIENVPLVHLPGIDHLILPDHGEDDRSDISGFCKRFDSEAFGILRISHEKNSMRPLVYVEATGTAVYERGCGSGSAALISERAFAAKRSSEMDILQPGGMIHAAATFNDGQITDIKITGHVRIAAIGTAFIS